jgi:hypothetical protein
MATCAICCEAFNAAARKPVACHFCQYEACSACVRAYLLSRPEAAACMSCHAVWDDEALERGLPKAFLNGAYKDHQATLLLEREKARLPEAQAQAKGELEARRLEAENAELRAQLGSVHKRYTDLVSVWELRGIIHHNARMARRARNGDGAFAEEAKAARYVHRCPKDGCRGFLAGGANHAAHTCGLCETKCCVKCLVVLGAPADSKAGKAGHTCNPDDVKTVQELVKSTRPCPTCAIPIYKVSGCDQMFCTSCHTAFSWNTGKIETGRIHNPHWYEWQRQQAANVGAAAPREPGDLVCGGLPDYMAVAVWIGSMDITARMYRSMHMQEYMLAKGARDTLIKVHQALAHIEGVVLPPLRREAAARQANVDLRVKYLLGEITDAKMKQELMKRDKAARKKRAMAQVIEMLTTVAGDVLRAHLAMDVSANVSVQATVDAIVGLVTQLNGVRDFANEALATISRRYDCVVLQIGGDDGDGVWGQRYVRVGK